MSPAIVCPIFNSVIKIFQIDVTQDSQRTYKRNSEVRMTNDCYHGKATSITYSECVFLALVIQHAKRIPLLY